jgi:hypothetical protein
MEEWRGQKGLKAVGEMVDICNVQRFPPHFLSESVFGLKHMPGLSDGAHKQWGQPTWASLSILPIDFFMYSSLIIIAMVR